MPQIYLSIIIPSYNEEKRITRCLRKIDSYLGNKRYSYELIVINDGSNDQTMSVIKNLPSKISNLKIISYPQNQGKGYAIRTGVLSCKGRYILLTDTDLSTPIEAVGKLLVDIKKNPIVIGSRYLEKGSIKIAQPLLRKMISRVGNFLIKIILGLNFTDTQCGFKLFQSNAAKKIFQQATIKRWGFDMEILSIAQTLGYQIKEIAVPWYNDSHSRLRAARAAWQTFKELCQIKINLITGKYQ